MQRDSPSGTQAACGEAAPPFYSPNFKGRWFHSLPFDDAFARRCASVRRDLERAGLIIGPHDLQIAATALQHNLTLVTHNTAEFSRIAGLSLEDWEA